MKYNRVFIDSIGYELAPVVVSSQELEERLEPTFRALHLPSGQLEGITGIVERRWWDTGYTVSDGATAAARKALAAAPEVPADAIDALIYAGVCREQFEPATACHVAAALGIGPNAAVHDVSNACLGVLNGIVDVANRIELGQCRAGLVVSCETARDINEVSIQRLNERPTMDLFKSSLATLTGGSGAVAVLLTDGSFRSSRRRVVGGVTQAAPQFFRLCRWGIEGLEGLLPSSVRQFASTDSVAVLKHGVSLGLNTWTTFLRKFGWVREQIDKVICHQVGGSHRDTILSTLGISEDKDFSTYPYLGNMGTVSLPMTAALAEERDFLKQGDRVGFLGIGSGLNCLMLGLDW
ncbi:MAG: 3-oxoacyl-ACP synthase III [Planctomycetia bacterium]|nr:3-oxoacyl-ACP synthase III [Planctomycetia bacterium]